MSFFYDSNVQIVLHINNSFIENMLFNRNIFRGKYRIRHCHLQSGCLNVGIRQCVIHICHNNTNLASEQQKQKWKTRI